MEEIRLSSKLTNIGLYGAVLLLFIVAPIIYSSFETEGFNIGMLIAAALLLVLGFFLVYQFKYVSSAKLVNNKLVLKKQFKSPETYTFDKIEKVSSFKIKNTKYTTVKLKGKHNSLDKYVIINSQGLLFSDKIDAERKLIELKELARLN